MTRLRLNLIRDDRPARFLVLSPGLRQLGARATIEEAFEFTEEQARRRHAVLYFEVIDLSPSDNGPCRWQFWTTRRDMKHAPPSGWRVVSFYDAPNPNPAAMALTREVIERHA